MTDYAGPLYEANFIVTDEASAELESWLEGVISAALLLDGIASALTFDENESES